MTRKDDSILVWEQTHLHASALLVPCYLSSIPQWWKNSRECCIIQRSSWRKASDVHTSPCSWERAKWMGLRTNLSPTWLDVGLRVFQKNSEQCINKVAEQNKPKTGLQNRKLLLQQCGSFFSRLGDESQSGLQRNVCAHKKKLGTVCSSNHFDY